MRAIAGPITVPNGSVAILSSEVPPSTAPAATFLTTPPPGFGAGGCGSRSLNGLSSATAVAAEGGSLAYWANGFSAILQCHLCRALPVHLIEMSGVFRLLSQMVQRRLRYRSENGFFNHRKSAAPHLWAVGTVTAQHRGAVDFQHPGQVGFYRFGGVGRTRHERLEPPHLPGALRRS